MLLAFISSSANKKKYRSTERYKEIVLTTPNEVLEVLVIFGPGVLLVVLYHFVRVLLPVLAFSCER